MLAKSETGVHKVTDDIVKELQAKHPKPEKIQDETLLQGPINKVPASYFDEIDEKWYPKHAPEPKVQEGHPTWMPTNTAIS